MSDFKQLDQEVDNSILTGTALEAFDKFYADDVVMVEGDGKTFEGKAVNRKREEEFFGSVEQFHGAEILAKAYGDNVSFAEWVYDVTFKGGQRVKMEQVAVRHWKNGKIVKERFYYFGAH
ncbi:MAG: nuclear transport factor 2 family protein [Acidobacteria bacterium]|nr:nuclear transport factor 2 family protein [Acidobacteriota bacterium]